MGAEADVYAELFEPASPLANRLRASGSFATAKDVIAAAGRVAALLSDADQVATLNAHPRIGEDPTRLSSRSLAEQGTEQRAELALLNAEYENRFGFRFVTFVNRRSQSEVAAELRERLRRSRDVELAAGIDAILAIAASRASNLT